MFAGKVVLIVRSEESKAEARDNRLLKASALDVKVVSAISAKIAGPQCIVLVWTIVGGNRARLRFYVCGCTCAADRDKS